MKFVFFVVFLISFQTTYARSKSLADTKKNSKVRVLELSKSSYVYKKPNFDSKVLLKLSSGKRILGSKVTYEGEDGFGLFHKVRLKKGVYGYIVDTSVVGFEPTGILKKKQKKKRGGFFSNKGRKKKNLSPTLSKSAGLTYSYLNYSIKAIDETLTSGVSAFGLKFSGPWLIKNLPLDISVFFSPSAPNFFESISTKASGFLGFLDVSYQSAFLKAPKQEAYWNVGAVLSYYSFDVLYNGETESRASSQLDFGFSAGLGYAYNFEPFLVRLEGRYYKTNESHLAGLISLQRYF